MKIAIATDHNGKKKKKEIINKLVGYEVIDMSTDNNPTDDYPDFAFKVGEAVRDHLVDYGVLLCGTGIGMSIAANKVKGVRAAHISNIDEAHLAHEHNNANVITMSYKNNVEDIVSWIKEFLETEFSNEERHIRRVDKINKYEEDNN